MEFQEFPKMGRLSRDVIISEKIDGTNAQVCITPEGVVLAGSRNRWVTPTADNFGFAAWVKAHEDELRALGEGRHYGEWWGSRIQRGYGLPSGEKRFSLFNVQRWCLASEEPREIPTGDPRVTRRQERAPACCHVVPVLYEGLFQTMKVDHMIERLRHEGSLAAPGFMKPEGVVVYHKACGTL